MVKFVKYGKQIVSLQNVLEVKLTDSESQHTSHGIKYTSKHYMIHIDYISGRTTHIETPNNDEKAARELFQTIFEELNAD